MDELYEYKGSITCKVVTKGQRGPVLRFCRDGDVVTEVHLTHDGAKRLAAALTRPLTD